MLTPIAENSGVVLAGSWNIRIFSPQWIVANVTKTKAVQLEFALNNPSLPFRLQFDGIRMHFGANRLTVNPLQFTPEALTRTQEVATMVLEKLPETPLRAAGVNFGFRVDQWPQLVTDVLTTADEGQLAKAGAAVESRSIRRGLRLASGVPLNLTFEATQTGGKTIHINFHADAKSAPPAITHIKQGVDNLRKASEELLKTVFGF